MSLRHHLLTLILILNSGPLPAAPFTARQEALIKQDYVLDLMKQVSSFQVAAYGENVHTDWKAGTFYSGVYAAYRATGESHFSDQARAWCEAAGWTLPENHFFADDICTGQTFLDIYLDGGEPYMIADVKASLEEYFAKESVHWKEVGWPVWREEDQERPFTGRNAWWWCDSLYMAPPLLTRLYAATGDQRYLDLLNNFYWDSVDYLFSEEEGLFYRDKRFFDAKTPGGRPVFWSRGNGWVYAGLIRLLDYLPEDDPYRPRYLELYRKMTRAIVRYQGDDGMWRSSLNEPSWQPFKESSGTSFFCFGLLGGINRGYLDRRAFLPVALKAWEGLTGCVDTSGKLGYAQLVSGEPANVRPEDFIDYTHGAFLLAASELYRMNLGEDDLEALSDPFEIRLLARDGAWTWFNDERVVTDGNGLFIGGVDSSGTSRMDYYSLVPAQSLFAYQRYPLSSWTEKDDHNNPALLLLDDGQSILAAYARHNTESKWYHRTGRIVGTPDWRTIEWGQEQVVEAPSPVTYNNLVQLSGEDGRIFNFDRCIGWNPTLWISEDNAGSWGEPIELIRSGDERTRPYVKYCSDGRSRIDLVFTDAHPRDDADNNIYHMYYQGGAFFRSDGSLIRTLEDVRGQPIIAAEATLVYSGSEVGRGWVWDLEYDAAGQPFLAFITSADGDTGNDLRYHLGHWNPESGQWRHQPVAFAGSHLYPAEQHYAGGIALVPGQTDRIFLSANVDPVTGEPNSTGRWQLFKGTRTAGGWEFLQLTHDAQADNLRPVVPRGDGETVLWFRGRYDTYEDFNCAVVGIPDTMD